MFLILLNIALTLLLSAVLLLHISNCKISTRQHARQGVPHVVYPPIVKVNGKEVAYGKGVGFGKGVVYERQHRETATKACSRK